MESITKKLSEYIVQSTYEDLPTDVINQAKRCFIDWMGVTLLGANSTTGKILFELIKELGGKKQASVIQYPLKTNVLNASLMNGAMSHVNDYDDVHSEAILHTSGILAPPALAGGEWKRKSGKEIISAFVMGFEVATRVSFAAGRGRHQLDRGWHPTSTIGRMGAAVCFGKLLGLDPNQMAITLGIAATQSAGLRRVFGTMTKHFHPGKACYDGILSALLASRGFSAPMDIFEGSDGICQVLAQRFDEDELLDGLGERFEILNNSFKPYPACYQTHSVINACLDISDQISSSSDVEGVICEINPIAIDVAAIKDPQDGNEAKFSLYYCAARSLMGDVSLSKFRPEEVRRDDIRQLMKQVQLKVNPSLTIQNALVEVKMKNGQVIKSKVDRLKGGPSNPMTDDEMDTKFMDLALPVLKKKNKTKEVLHLLRNLESLKNIRRLMSLVTLPT
ncbi:MAG: MmgE/PrpD family protein [Thermodesulfobacteriota bacterium]|nr:MmgE/PrpD family protein [Thermodesulfobacteriota bacterium]